MKRISYGNACWKGMVFGLLASALLLPAMAANGEGLLKEMPVDRAIQECRLEGAVTSGEILNAVSMYFGMVNPNNNRELHDRLRMILKKRELPKGAWLTRWKETDHEAVMLELGRDVQNTDLVPEPGSVDRIIKIPIRVVCAKQESEAIREYGKW